MKTSYVLIFLLILVIGVSIFGAIYITRRPMLSTINLSPTQVISRQIVDNQKIAIGIEGTHTEDFPTVKAWGGNMVHYYLVPGDTHTVSSVLDEAKKSGLSLFISIAKITQFNNSFDLASLRANPNRYLPDNQLVAGDPAFLGYWLIDEPCNPSKSSPVEARSFNDLYLAVKAINPKIPIVINFGYLECLQGFVNTSQPGWKLADIAMFTITEKKLHDNPNLISQQAALAKSAKAFDPGMKIYPQIAVLGFQDKGRNLPLPSASWTTSTGLEVAKHLDSFDGIVYYSFRSYANVKFIGASISDVENDPSYVSAFKSVFAAAGK